MKVDKTKWGKKTLGEICYIYDSQRKPVSKENRIKGIYPYYGATGLQDYVHDYIFDGRYLLLGEDGGKWNAKENSAYIVEGKIWVNNHAHILQFKNNIIDSYICYYLNYSDLMEYITGSIVPKLTQAKMRKIEIPIPPLTEQRDIAAELDAVQKMIEGYKAQLADLDTLAQSIFLDMFGDPITNPKGWEKEYLSNICVELSTGPFGSMLHKTDYQEDGIPTINPQDIKSNKIKIDNIAKVSQEKAKVLFRYSLKENDIILARRGDLSKCAVITSKENGWLCGTGSFFLRLKNLLPIIFYHQYTTDSIQKYLNNKSAGATMPNLNQGILSQLLIAIPPLPLQQQFAERVEAIERQKELLQAQLAEAQTLMAERMQYYFD